MRLGSRTSFNKFPNNESKSLGITIRQVQGESTIQRIGVANCRHLVILVPWRCLWCTHGCWYPGHNWNLERRHFSRVFHNITNTQTLTLPPCIYDLCSSSYEFSIQQNQNQQKGFILCILNDKMKPRLIPVCWYIMIHNFGLCTGPILKPKLFSSIVILFAYWNVRSIDNFLNDYEVTLVNGFVWFLPLRKWSFWRQWHLNGKIRDMFLITECTKML